MADTVDLEELTIQLYASAPEDFVKARADGVKQLKADGQDDAAAAFAKLAKPSLSAWAVNLLVSKRAGVVGDVVERGDALRRAHTGGGGPKEIRGAQQARQEAIRAATDLAVELSGRQLSEAHRNEIAETLEAAASDADAAEEMRHGRLVRPIPAPTGFDLFGGLTVLPGGQTGRKRSASPAADAEAGAADAGEQAQHAGTAMLDAEAASALAAAEAAGEAAAATRERVAALEKERTRVEGELRRLDGELVAVRREAREAERAASDAERKAARAATRAQRGRS